MTVRATHGDRLDPPLPRLDFSEPAQVITYTEQKNGFAWSEQGQPENVPPGNYDSIGLGELYGATATRDAIFVWTSEGLYRLSGTGGQAGRGYDWRTDPVDSTISLSGPQATCVLQDIVYAMTDRGFVSVDSSGTITEISRGRIENLIPPIAWPLQGLPVYTHSNCVECIADLVHNEILIKHPNFLDRVTRYNVHTDTFTQDFPSSTGGSIVNGVFSEALNDMLYAVSASGGLLAKTLAGNYGPLDVIFNPIFADNPFGLRHWQQIDIAFTVANTALSLATNATVAGTRDAFGVQPGSPAWRSSWSVPRNAPAVTNQMIIGIAHSAIVTAPVVLSGLAISFCDFTEQRPKR
jgi:hypothetical protein